MKVVFNRKKNFSQKHQCEAHRYWKDQSWNYIY